MPQFTASWFPALAQGTLPRVVLVDGPVPIYQQVATILRDRIASGEYLRGSRIPSLVALTAEFGIAEVTVQKAVNLLKADGLLIGSVGRGTYVAEAG